MSMAQLSPNVVSANPAHINPQVKTDQTLSIPQINQDAQHSVQAAKTDSVTISPQALQMLERS